MSRQTQNPVIEENAIEKIFCPMLKGKENTPLDTDVTKLFIEITLNSPLPIPSKNSKKFNDLPFSSKVLISRTSLLDFKFTDLGIVLLISMIADSLGECTMYLIMIQQWCKENNVREFSKDTFVKMFPFGIYSKEDLHKAWDVQKIKASPDNLLDHSKALTSLRF